jgi:hypothetical protein
LKILSVELKDALSGIDLGVIVVAVQGEAMTDLHMVGNESGYTAESIDWEFLVRIVVLKDCAD